MPAVAYEPEIESAADAALQAIEEEKAARAMAAAEIELEKGRELAEAPDAEEKAREARLLAGTPTGFAKMVLGLALYLWQAIVLSWFENTLELVKGSVCTPNGAGKSAVIDAALALWWISVHPQGIVVITTKDSKQLDNQLWPALTRHKQKFPAFEFIERMVRNGTGGFIIGFTTDDPGRVEGWHKLNDFTGPLLIIEDEAKSVLEAIDMATDRCTYNAKLVSSSPGLTEGFFYASQTKNAGELYDAKGFKEAGPASREYGYKAMKVGLVDCPHIPKSRINAILEQYGPDHWFTRSTLYGEFTDADSDTLFVMPRQMVKSLMEASAKGEIPYVAGGKRASCDFAAGRAENVFTVKEGNKITQHCWKDPDPMRAINQFIAYFVQYGLLPSEIDGDAGGIGIPILRRFAELNWPINWINNESEPLAPELYPNLAAEHWHEGARILARHDIILPNDPILLEQLCTRRAAPATRGILGLESKKDMQKRGVVSPDRADGLVMVINAEAKSALILFDETGLAKLEGMARPVRAETGVIDLTGTRATYETKPGGWLTVYEKPIVGYNYICVVNPYRHDEPLGNHVVMVVRASYWEEKEGEMRPARLAAKVRISPFRLDSGPLAELVAKVSGWYGRCIVVPIANDRGDVIEKLLDAGLQVYAREKFEVHKHGRRRDAIEFGWVSDDFTRSMWIGALAERIREDKVIVEDVQVVMQLYQMDGRGGIKREAEALGVALQLENRATAYMAPEKTFRFGADTREIDTTQSMIS
jgi:phage terminase large subunit